MSRIIKITNPTDQSPRFVNISMTIISEGLRYGEFYKFNVTMTDHTAKNTVANMAGLLTHDLRSFMRAGINLFEEDRFYSGRKRGRVCGRSREDFIDSSREELSALFDTLSSEQESRERRDEHLLEILRESLTMCSSSREDFLPESVVKQYIVEQSDEEEIALLVDLSSLSWKKKIYLST
jgi:hypothetical protein